MWLVCALSIIWMNTIFQLDHFLAGITKNSVRNKIVVETIKSNVNNKQKKTNNRWSWNKICSHLNTCSTVNSLSSGILSSRNLYHPDIKREKRKNNNLEKKKKSAPASLNILNMMFPPWLGFLAQCVASVKATEASTLTFPHMLASFIL